MLHIRASGGRKTALKFAVTAAVFLFFWACGPDMGVPGFQGVKIAAYQKVTRGQNYAIGYEFVTSHGSDDKPDLSIDWYETSGESDPDGTYKATTHGDMEFFYPDTSKTGIFYYYGIFTNTLNGEVSRQTSNTLKLEIVERPSVEEVFPEGALVALKKADGEVLYYGPGGEFVDADETTALAKAVDDAVSRTALEPDTIVLLADFNLNNAAIAAIQTAWPDTAVKNITLTVPSGKSHGITRSESGTGAFFTINALSSFILEGSGAGTLTLNGGGSAVTAAEAFIKSAGELIISDGVTLKDNNSTGEAGAIHVVNGTTTIKAGAAILNNKKISNGGASAIRVDSNGTLVMTGGEISGNYDPGDGTVCIDGTFNMSGGTISNNVVAGNGGGVSVNSGGVFNLTGAGEISGNKTDGNGGGFIIRSNGVLNMSGGIVKNNSATAGGGILIIYGGTQGGTANLSGGRISGNIGSSGFGAGIAGGQVSNINMSGGIIIDANNSITTSSTVNITGRLTGASPVATIAPASYINDTAVLAGAYLDAVNVDKFALTHNAADPPGSPPWWIMNAGTEMGKMTNRLMAATRVQAGTILKYSRLYDAIGDSSGGTLANPDVITIVNNIKIGLPDGNADYAGAGTITAFTTGKHVKLTVQGATRKLVRANISTGVFFTLNSGASLTLEGAGSNEIVLDGDNYSTVCPLVSVNGGEFIIKNGAVLEKAKNNGSDGGGGVTVVTGVSRMSGGRIQNNHSFFGGGGVCIEGGVFYMTGGTIKGNTGGFGKSIYNNGAFHISAAAVIDSDNNVFIAKDKTITIDGAISGAFAAEVQPQNYELGEQILDGASYIAANYAKFGLTEQDSQTPWSINSLGKLDMVTPPSWKIRLVKDGTSTRYTNLSDFSTAFSAATGTNNTIEIFDDGASGYTVIDLTSRLTVSNTLKIISFGAPLTIERAQSLIGSMFVVNSGGNLTITGYTGPGRNSTLIIDGGGTGLTNVAAIVRIAAGGTFELGDNAVLTNNELSTSGGNPWGAGVFADGSSGSTTVFKMSGGKIHGNSAVNSDNYGGGVALSFASFEMTGGEIYNNTATLGAGIYMGMQSPVVFKGGTVYGVNATSQTPNSIVNNVNPNNGGAALFNASTSAATYGDAGDVFAPGENHIEDSITGHM